MLSTDFDTHTITSGRADAAADATARRGIRGRRSQHGSGLRARVGTGLHHRRLDRELAVGLPIADSPERALRAAQLTDIRTRAMLARSLRQLVTDAQARRAGLSPRVTPARSSIENCDTAMLALADRIASDTPVSVIGVARARLLLTDGCGPLYNRTARHSLRSELRGIADALDDPR